jgi:hypothetical protein
VLVVGELAHVGADLAHHDERRGHVDAVDACQVHAAHLEQLRAQVELRRISRLAALLALGRLGLGGLQRLQPAVGLFFIVGRVVAQACIGDARQLVGQRTAGLVVVAAILNGQRPGAQARDLLARVARCRGGAQHASGEVPIEFRLPTGRSHAAMDC